MKWRRLRRSAARGVDYVVLNNEPSLWHETHPDVDPVGTGDDRGG